MNYIEQENILNQPENVFNKPNLLIDTLNQNSLSVKATKIYFILLRDILKQNVEEFKTRNLYTSESSLVKIMGVKNRAGMKNILQEIRNYYITFIHKFRTKDGKLKEKEVGTGLITKFSIDKKGKQSVRVEFDDDLINEILRLYISDDEKIKLFYTELDLGGLMNLKSSNSIRLYEIFKYHLAGHKNQYKDFTEKEIRKKLGIENKYTSINDFNTYVIKKSLEEINKNVPLFIKLIKIVRPNTKDNQTDDRIYKFKVKKISSNLLSFSNFIEFIRTSNKTIECKYRSIDYKLYAFSDFSKLNDESKKFIGIDSELFDISIKNKNLWKIDKSGKNTTKLVSNSIWKLLYSEYLKNPEKFLFNHNLTKDELDEFKKNI